MFICASEIGGFRRMAGGGGVRATQFTLTLFGQDDGGVVGEEANAETPARSVSVGRGELLVTCM